MANYDWAGFLVRFNRAILEYLSAGFADGVSDDITPDVIESGWMGFPGATDAQIEAAEARLRVKLPPAYRSFLQTSNGFWMPGNLVPRLFSTDEIFRHPQDDWGTDFVPDSEYFVYGPQQRPETIRYEYLNTSLVISETEESGTALHLLNPQITFEDGEWEAWLFAHWLPGANRYRSFWDLMQAEYEQYVRIVADGKSALSPDDSPEAVLAKLPNLIGRFNASIAQYAELLKIDGIHRGTMDGLTFAREQTVKLQIRTQDSKRLCKALALLARELEERHQAEERRKAQNPLGQIADLTSQGLGDMRDFLYQQQVLEGYRQAAIIIRWFLNTEDVGSVIVAAARYRG